MKRPSKAPGSQLLRDEDMHLAELVRTKVSASPGTDTAGWVLAREEMG